MKGIRKIYYGPRDNPKVIEQKYLTVDELKPGWLYRIRARNASLGIWTPEFDGFHISRYKFGSNYLFVEIHWDLSESFGTALPFEAIEPAPFKLELLKNWDTKRSVHRHVLKYLNRKARELLDD
jgi:hypothetical protein